MSVFDKFKFEYLVLIKTFKLAPLGNSLTYWSHIKSGALAAIVLTTTASLIVVSIKDNLRLREV